MNKMSTIENKDTLFESPNEVLNTTPYEDVRSAKTAGDRLTCELCPRLCQIPEGGTGFCQARSVLDGEIKSLNYGELLSVALDPIEKKPLAFFKPGYNVLSVGTFGCNMNCLFCQNHTIARAKVGDYTTRYVSPKELVALALVKRKDDNIGIAFTYNEPLVGFEYVRDTAQIARQHNLETIVVTNGQINEAYLNQLLPYITAWNIDLKSFSKEIYGRLGGDLDTTLRTIRLANIASHVEVTTLIVPGISDDQELFKEQVKYLSTIDPDMPLHITRYFPRYRYDEDATSQAVLTEFYDIATRYLNRVRLGNV
ncbi:MAG: radical SAM protein [Fastidiosipilaceae bacterium]|jgi:pyruvate formate lyase activating enzyme